MLKLDQNYSDYTDETDSEYPEGKAVNASTSESFDGTPLLASFMNNIIGAMQAMYKKAFGSTEGIDGNADTVNNSQFADAVAKYSDDRLATHADKRGENAHGATVAATPGQLAARDEYGNLQVGDAIEDEDAVNLKTAEQMFDDANIKEAAHRDVDTVVTAGSENLPTSGAVNNALADYLKKSDFPYVVEIGSNEKGNWKKWNNGLIEQWGAVYCDGVNTAKLTYPYPYATKPCLTAMSQVTVTAGGASIGGWTEAYVDTSWARVYARGTGGVAGNISWYAIGYGVS